MSRYIQHTLIYTVLIFCIFSLFKATAFSEINNVSSSLTVNELAQQFLSKKNLPTFQLSGSFEFFSAYESNVLEPRSSSKFNGVIDFSTLKVNFDFSKYKQPLIGGTTPFRVSDLKVTFDGDKWITIRTPEENKDLSANIAHLVEVSEKQPSIFLRSLDHLCFPLFAPLTIVQVNEEMYPFLQALASSIDTLNIFTRMEDKLLVLTFKSPCFTDEYKLAPDKNFALVSRTTDFSGCTTNKDNTKLVNKTTITEFGEVSGMWYPKKAQFSQFSGEKEVIRRIWIITEAKIINGEYSFESIIPAKSYVSDTRFDISFLTSSDGVSK